MGIDKDLIAASSIPILLAVLRDEPCYGYAIIRKVAELSQGRLEWSEGMLYPVLHRLEEQGFVEASWMTAENGRKRKYYRTTQEGSAELDRIREQWEAVSETLERTGRPAGRDPARGRGGENV